MLKTATQWLPKWKANGFVKSNGEPVKNADLVRELDHEMSRFPVQFEKVPAHRGFHGNEMADKFAKRGAKY